VKGESVCASLRGMPIEPCFNLTKIDNNSFRGAISGLGFAYCEFTRNPSRPKVRQAARDSSEPLGLRPSLKAENQ
jgi:hypothetical protein